ncbi:hypothetical protein K7432_012624 [Basidiobolus ranarum]|uniref:Yeast cell wall synthesis Kre9/Knh1-like N-terminal domain-containing protein n=1 Tax=Basidiobolus ranarum TaxID=34480 RepID=A0ABR2WKH8_9FUNG
MFTKSIVSVALLAASVVADYSITQPVDGTVWKSGSKVIITWTADSQPPAAPAKFDLTLMSGDEKALQVTANIASGVDTAAGKYEWTVPAGIEKGTTYAVRAGNGGEVKYSHFFSVAAGNAASSAASVSAAPSSSAKPSGSSTGSLSATGSVAPKPSVPVSSNSTASATPSSASKASSSASKVATTANTSAPPVPTQSKAATGGSAQLSGSIVLAAIPAALMALFRQ